LNRRLINFAPIFLVQPFYQRMENVAAEGQTLKYVADDDSEGKSMHISVWFALDNL